MPEFYSKYGDENEFLDVVNSMESIDESTTIQGGGKVNDLWPYLLLPRDRSTTRVGTDDDGVPCGHGVHSPSKAQRQRGYYCCARPARRGEDYGQACSIYTHTHRDEGGPVGA